MRFNISRLCANGYSTTEEFIGTEENRREKRLFRQPVIFLVPIRINLDKIIFMGDKMDFTRTFLKTAHRFTCVQAFIH